jgi:tRNA pseudouridine55 synthase
MYSALKRDGQPLYRLARRGITVERTPRIVEVHDIRIVGWQPPDLVVQIECSKGTYVRSLAYDLGQALGVGAILADLARLAVGSFRLEEAVSLEALIAAGANDAWKCHLRPMRAALGDMPGVEVDGDTARQITFGRAVALDPKGATQRCYAYDSEDTVLAIMRRSGEGDLWQPEKVLLAR